jgi:hypothetical protein
MAHNNFSLAGCVEFLHARPNNQAALPFVLSGYYLNRNSIEIGRITVLFC